MTAKGMALTGWKILTDDNVAEQIARDFEEDRKMREILSAEKAS
jgi:hypothetical protein